MSYITLQKVQENNIYFLDNSTKQLKTRTLTKTNTFLYNKRKYFYNGSDIIEETKILQEQINIPKPANNPNTKNKQKTIQSKFNINKRFKFLEKFTSMVLYDITPSLLITGEGGLGKTYTVRKMLDINNLEEDIDYVIIKGYSTPKGLYETLYLNRDKILIFDDCDSILKDKTSLNLLKGALDSYDKRTISWLSKGFIDDGLPTSFDFEGQVIFISNLDLENVDNAVRSRTMSVDLSMSLEDKVLRMRSIIKDILPNYPLETKNKVLDYLDKHKENAKEFNIRTFEKSIKVFDFYDSEIEAYEAINYLLTNV